jgi:hypothetical protein
MLYFKYTHSDAKTFSENVRRRVESLRLMQSVDNTVVSAPSAMQGAGAHKRRRRGMSKYTDVNHAFDLSNVMDPTHALDNMIMEQIKGISGNSGGIKAVDPGQKATALTKSHLGSIVLPDDQFHEHEMLLNKQQRAIYDEFRHFSVQERRGQRVKGAKPLRWFLSGGAGTGKTFLTRVMYTFLYKLYEENEMQLPFCIAAPTGVAAWNVRGQTLHTLFSIPVQKAGESYTRVMLPLSDERLKRIRDEIRHVK